VGNICSDSLLMLYKTLPALHAYSIV
jgi:hypothetical protein